MNLASIIMVPLSGFIGINKVLLLLHKQWDPLIFVLKFKLIFYKLRYQKDNNAEAHYVDHILCNDSSTPSCMMVHRWRSVTRDCDKKKAHTLH